MGFILDPETGNKRRVHAPIFTAVVSRHMFVWLTYSHRLVATIAGCEAAWDLFGGVFRVLIPDNLKAVVTTEDAVNPPDHHRRRPLAARTARRPRTRQLMIGCALV